MKDRWKYLIGAAWFLLIALLLLGGGGYRLYMDNQAVATYEEVNATVEESWVETEIRTGDDGDRERTYYPNVRYMYTYEGTTYNSTSLRPGPGRFGTGEGPAQDIVSNHQPGDTVTAYVNPDNPAESFLIKDTAILIPVALLLGGLLPLYWGVNTLKKAFGLFGNSESPDKA